MTAILIHDNTSKLTYAPEIRTNNSREKLSPGNSPGGGLTRGTGSASEDYKSEDYKRFIGKLFLFLS